MRRQQYQGQSWGREPTVRSVIAKKDKMLVRLVLLSILMFRTGRMIMVRRRDPEPACLEGWGPSMLGAIPLSLTNVQLGMRWYVIHQVLLGQTHLLPL
jgi:hypothetical protein